MLKFIHPLQTLRLSAPPKTKHRQKGLISNSNSQTPLPTFSARLKINIPLPRVSALGCPFEMHT